MSIKIASTVQVAVRKFAKNSKKMDAVAADLSQPLLHSIVLE